MRTLSMTLFIAIYLGMGLALMYTVASHKDVTKGISEGLRIGITR